MLPDYVQRNELKFWIMPAVPYNARLATVLALWLAGFAAQAVGFLWPGTAVILVGTVLALTRGYSNEPSRVGEGRRRWENVTLEQFQTISSLDAESRRWDRSAWIDATNVWGCLAGLLLYAVVLMASLTLAQRSHYLAKVCYIDGLLIVVPFWLTGIRRLYHRTELMIRVQALANILKRLEAPDARGLMAAPMLELQKTERGDLPLDVKLMARIDDAPDGFMGIQVQVSLNDVSGTKYPYLYCVILAKPAFGLHGWNLSLPRQFGKMDIEPRTTEEVELVVVRQHTTRTSGYHTKKSAQIYVFDAALWIVRQNLKRPS